MTAITDTRKRFRDEDSCDFMPISKRINNLTLGSQCFGDGDVTVVPNLTADYLMAINDQDAQSNYFAQHNHQMPQHQANYHQSQVQPNNHSNAYHNGSHLGTNQFKSNQEQMHQMHHHHHLHNADSELNNNEMEVYCPELTPDENPFYYNKNKLLFDLHIERQRRHQNHL